MPAHPEAPVAERAPRVPVTASPLHVFVVLVALLLPGCDRGKVEKLETENTKLKGELEKVQEQVKELAAKQKQDAATQEQEETKRKHEAQNEQDSKRLRSIVKGFERMDLIMAALLGEPKSFNGKEDKERDALKDRLESLANSKKAELGEIIIDLKGLGISDAEKLQKTIEDFIVYYEAYVSAEKQLSYYRVGDPEYDKEQDFSIRIIQKIHDTRQSVTEAKNSYQSKLDQAKRD